MYRTQTYEMKASTANKIERLKDLNICVGCTEDRLQQIHDLQQE